MSANKAPEPPEDEGAATEWLSRLDIVVRAVDQMKPRERLAAFGYLKARYSREWPSDSY